MRLVKFSSTALLLAALALSAGWFRLALPVLAGAPLNRPLHSTARYFDSIEQRLVERWNIAASERHLPLDVCLEGKAVLEFRLSKDGKVDRVRFKHVALEAVLPIHRYHSADACNALDQSLLEAIASASPLPEPPVELHCPRTIVVLFDPTRFKPLRVMLDMEPRRVSGLRHFI